MEKEIYEVCVKPTWIFMAISLPSFNTPWCTWPMEAAAKGLSSNDKSFSLQPDPSSSSRTFYLVRKEKKTCCSTFLSGFRHHFLCSYVRDRSYLHSFAIQAWSLHFAELSQRSSAAGGWWMCCLKRAREWRSWKKTASTSEAESWCKAAAAVCTLYAEHLAYLECRSTDLTQCVDYSLSVGLWQEGWVKQGTHVYKTLHTYTQTEYQQWSEEKNIKRTSAWQGLFTGARIFKLLHEAVVMQSLKNWSSSTSLKTDLTQKLLRVDWSQPADHPSAEQS